MRKTSAFVCLVLACSPLLPAEDAPAEGWRRLARPYTARPIAAVDMSNSPRVRQIMRAGNIYLSLSDAIALALENNLDIELQRYDAPIANTELLRAKGGGLLRGLSFNLAEVPVGVGGPASPLVTAAASPIVPGSSVPTNPSELGVLAEPQTNLSVQGNIASSSGPPIPLFDPAINAQLNWAHQTSLQTNPAAAIASNTTLGNIGYVQGFGPGTQLGIVFDNSAQSLNPSRGFSPFISSSFGFTVTQPLLRGFGLSVNRRFIRIAKNEQRIAGLLFQQQLIATVYGVVRLYTDLVALYEDVKVKEGTLASAEKLFADTKAQVEEGTQAPIEQTRANAQVFSIRQDLINARGLLQEQEAIMRSVVTRRTSTEPDLMSARIIPTDSINVPPSDDVRPIQELLADAFRNRPDLLQAGLQVDDSRIGLEGSRNALRPEVDLVGVAQNNAFAGNPVAAGIDANLNGGFGTALDQIFTRKYPVYGIGLQVNLPVRNRVAQADYARDEIQLRQTEIRAEQFRKQAQLEVEDALVAIRRARASYDAAMQTQALQQESLEAEQAKFQVGASTSFFIIQYESFLAQAKSTVVAAKSAYLKARAALERATGNILEANNVSVDQAVRGR